MTLRVQGVVVATPSIFPYLMKAPSGGGSGLLENVKVLLSNKTQAGELCFFRGDTVSRQFLLVDAENTPQDITGLSFLFTVDISPDPSDSLNNLFQLIGVVTDAAGGKFQFTPTAIQMDQIPDIYFYDIQALDSFGSIKTLVKDALIIAQDITK